MRVSIRDLQKYKDEGQRFAMITAYDAPTAQLCEEAGVPIVLVGDSLAMVVLGYESTLPVTLDDMLHHTKAVVRGTKRVHVVTDLPFLSYRVDPSETLRNAGRLLAEGGAQSVKIEGGESIAEEVRMMVEAGIPVMGHLGLTPQSVNQFGGYRVQGKSVDDARRILQDALILEQAGAYAIVLECVPAPVTEEVCRRLKIPVIGIGAGPADGQVLVLHDTTGMSMGGTLKKLPRFVHQFGQVGNQLKEAVAAYRTAVESGSFPAAEHQFEMDTEALARFTTESNVDKSRET